MKSALTEHIAGHCQNKRKTEQFQRRASLKQTGPSPAGGRRKRGGERGKLGPRDGTPYQTANRPPVSNQRLPEILDGWHPLGGSRLETSSPHRAHPTCTRGNWGWDRGGDEAHRTRGECARQAPGCLSCWAGERPKRRPNWVCSFVEDLKTGIARNSGPAPYRAAGSLSSVYGESTHTCHERGQTQCGLITASAPHTGQWHLSAAPLPPHSTNEQVKLNKRPPLPTWVRVEIRHWGDLQTEAKQTKGTASEVTGAKD